MNAVHSSHTSYTHLPNGIHHLLLLDNSREAADELLDFLHDYLTNLPTDVSETPLLLLVQLTQSGTPPLAYLSRCYLKLLQLHKPKQLYARIAYVYVGGSVTPLITSILDLLRIVVKVERRFFVQAERAHAEAWLLSGDEPSDTTHK